MQWLNEIEYFWNQEWRLEDLPDPINTSFGHLIDPFIYALLAAFCTRMVEVWNERMFEFNIQLIDDVPNKQEVAPDWTKRVSPSPFTIHFTPVEKLQFFPKLNNRNNTFAKFGFVACENEMSFV